MCVCLCVCLSFANDSSEPVEAIIIKLSTATASDMMMHHVLIILALTFIQDHTDINRENSKCSIISETVQTMPVNFAVMIVRLKIDVIFSQSDDLALHSRSRLRLKLDKRLNLNHSSHVSGSIYATASKPGTTVELCMEYIMLMLVPMTLTLMQGHSVSANANIQLNYFDN